MRGEPWRAALLALAATALVLGAIAVMMRPLEATMPVYLDLSAALREGPVGESFEPLGYPWLISLMPTRSLAVAVKLLHLACFSGLVMMVLAEAKRHLRRAVGWAQPVIVLLAAAALLNPYGLANLTRVNDNGVNTALVLLLYLVARHHAHPGREVATSLGGGALLGALMFIRPNLVSLLPILAVRPLASGRVAASVAACVAGLMLAYGSASMVATGRPGFWPSNGPYNLLAGNNPSAMASLVRDYNAESSLVPAMSWCGHAEPARQSSSSALLQCARRFLVESPVQAMSVTAYKFFNLMLRPNLRLADSPVEQALQWAMIILPAAWWGITLVSSWSAGRIVDPYTLNFVLLFALPFVVTNSDPRFRLPLDAIYATSLMQMAARQSSLRGGLPPA